MLIKSMKSIRTEFFLAHVRSQNWPEVIHLLKKHQRHFFPDKLNLNQPFLFGHTALMYAVHSGQLEVVSKLLKAGANPNLRTIKGFTALFYAAKSPHENSKKIVELLLQYNADINALNCDGNTPLMLAIKSGQKKIASFLLEKGADINTVDIKGRTPLICAILEGDAKVVDLLLKKGANIEAVDSYGGTAFLYAIAYDKQRIFDKLICQNPDINVQDKSGGTPLIHAVMNSNEHQLKAILAKKSKIDYLDKDGFNALMYAVLNQDRDCVRVLLEYGANPYVVSTEGKTALQYACEKKFHDGITLLTKYEAVRQPKTSNQQPAKMESKDETLEKESSNTPKLKRPSQKRLVKVAPSQRFFSSSNDAANAATACYPTNASSRLR